MEERGEEKRKMRKKKKEKKEIEMRISKIKGTLRKMAERTITRRTEGSERSSVI